MEAIALTRRQKEILFILTVFQDNNYNVRPNTILSTLNRCRWWRKFLPVSFEQLTSDLHVLDSNGLIEMNMWEGGRSKKISL